MILFLHKMRVIMYFIMGAIFSATAGFVPWFI